MAMACSIATAQVDVPPPGQRVTDLAQAFSAAETQRIAAALERLDRETGARVLVLVVPTLLGEPIEDFSGRVFEAWKPGRAGHDDGVLLVLSRQDRKMRIAVGRGLEGAIPDLMAKRITSATMVPAFKQAQFAKGFEDAIDAIDKLVRAELAARPLDAPVDKELAPVAICLSAALVLCLFIAGHFWHSRQARRQQLLRQREDHDRRRRDHVVQESTKMRETVQRVGIRTAPLVNRPAMSSPPRRPQVRRRDADLEAASTSFEAASSSMRSSSYESSSRSSADDSSTSSDSNSYSSSSSSGSDSGGGSSDSY